MSNHLENHPHLPKTPVGGSSAYPSEPIPQNFPWRAVSRPYHVGYPTTANPDFVYEPRFVVRPLPDLYRFMLKVVAAGAGRHHI